MAAATPPSASSSSVRDLSVSHKLWRQLYDVASQRELTDKQSVDTASIFINAATSSTAKPTATLSSAEIATIINVAPAVHLNQKPILFAAIHERKPALVQLLVHHNTRVHLSLHPYKHQPLVGICPLYSWRCAPIRISIVPCNHSHMVQVQPIWWTH